MKNRIKGLGSVFKRGKIFYLQYMLNGKYKKNSLQCTDKKAKEILFPLQTADTKETIVVHIVEARNIIKQGKGALTKAWELYLNNPARPDSSNATLKTYEAQWKRFKKWMMKEYPNITTLNSVNDDIAFSRNLIVDCKPQKTARKTNKTITVPMHPMLRGFVEKAYKWKENDYVLPKLVKRYVENPGYVNSAAIKVFKFNGFETSKKIEGGNVKEKQTFTVFTHSGIHLCHFAPKLGFHWR